jgi:hypothetical protein
MSQGQALGVTQQSLSRVDQQTHLKSIFQPPVLCSSTAMRIGKGYAVALLPWVIMPGCVPAMAEFKGTLRPARHWLLLML